MRTYAMLVVLALMAAGCGGEGTKSCEEYCQGLVDCGAKDTSDLEWCTKDCKAAETLMQPVMLDMRECVSGSSCTNLESCGSAVIARCTPATETAAVVDAICTKAFACGLVTSVEGCKSSGYYDMVMGCYRAEQLPGVHTCVDGLSCEAGVAGFNDCFGMYVMLDLF